MTAFCGAATVIVMSIATPLLIGHLVDSAIIHRRRSELMPLVGLLVLAYAFKGFGIFLRKRFAGKSEVGAETFLRSQMYAHVHGLDMAYHESMPTGQLMSRASSDLQLIGNTLGAFPFFTATFTYLIVVAILLLFIDLPLGGLMVATLPFMAAIAIRFTRKLDPIVYAVQEHLGEMTSVAEESVTGIRVVKAFGREADQAARFETRASKVLTESMKSVRIRALLQPMFELMPALSIATMLWFGGHRVFNGHMSLGSFVTFALYSSQLVLPVRAIGWFSSDIQQAITSARRIFEVLDTEPGISDRPGAGALHLTEGNLNFEDVTYTAGEKSILNGFGLSVPAGTSVALVGPTGCGKSTVLRLILRFIEPTSGSIEIDGQDIGAATLQSVRANIGTVFDDTFLFSDTIANNIAFGRPDATEEEIVEAACLAQAHGFIEELPEGYETVVGEQGYTLSGGQRQRVAIARAILMDAKILLLDDATSSVDPQVEALIRDGLSKAMSRRTTLIVARRPASAALADRVIFMENGAVSDAGHHSELWANNPSYRETLTGASLIEVT